MERGHGTETHKYTVCGFETSSEHSLDVHVLTHCNESFTCEVCARTFSSTERLDEHIQVTHVKEMFDHFVSSKKKMNNDQANKGHTSSSRRYSFEFKG